jgi:hypothetical protein
MTHLMPERPTCEGCGANAPETNTDYTLISRSFGWRLTRRKLATGAVVVEWRCAACWKKYKGERVVVPATLQDAPSTESAARPRSPASSSLPPSSQPRPIAKLAGGIR